MDESQQIGESQYQGEPKNWSFQCSGSLGSMGVWDFLNYGLNEGKIGILTDP